MPLGREALVLGNLPPPAWVLRTQGTGSRRTVKGTKRMTGNLLIDIILVILVIILVLKLIDRL